MNSKVGVVPECGVRIANHHSDVVGTSPSAPQIRRSVYSAKVMVCSAADCNAASPPNRSSSNQVVALAAPARATPTATSVTTTQRRSRRRRPMVRPAHRYTR
jgi:hypothetical protein